MKLAEVEDDNNQPDDRKGHKIWIQASTHVVARLRSDDMIYFN